MTEETNIPEMLKKETKSVKKTKIPVLNILLVFMCVFLLIISTFVELKITHFIIPKGLFSGKIHSISDFLYTYTIIPQVPVVLFVVGLMGRKLSITSIVLYILTGLFLIPVFALGGGLRYFTEFGFGYILAYIPAVCMAGTFLKNEFSLKNILKAALAGVLIIHFIGIMYMIVVSLFRNEGWQFVKGWILAQSCIKIVYDYALSVIALFIAKYANKYINYIIG